MFNTTPLRAAKGSSSRWLARQQRDPYAVSKSGGRFVSRAASKLQQMDEKYLLFPKKSHTMGFRVVDLGAAPGSWTQYAASKLFKNSDTTNSTLISVDLLDLSPAVCSTPGVRFIQGDLTSLNTQKSIQEALGDFPADLILSDMLHNTTGNRDRDAFLSHDLYTSVYEFAQRHLTEGGALVMKYYSSALAQEFAHDVLKKRFDKFARYKPASSRSESKEEFFVCRGFKGGPGE